MRNHLIIIIFLIVAGNAWCVQPDSVKITLHDRWFATDKAHHFLVSAFLTAAVNYTAQEEFGVSNRSGKGISIGISLSVGLFKEVYDGTIRKRHFSYKDMVADCAGIVAGILLFNAAE